jgi:hypothetical protein
MSTILISKEPVPVLFAEAATPFGIGCSYPGSVPHRFTAPSPAAARLLADDRLASARPVDDMSFRHGDAD